MNLEGLIQFPREVLAAPLEGRNRSGRKSKGRPSKAKEPNRYALNQKT